MSIISLPPPKLPLNIPHSTATSCRRDAADLYAELGDYTAAIERYKKVADSYMDSPLTRFNVKEIWLRQGLCALAMGDFTQASNLLTHTRNIDPTFQTTREAKFLSTLTDAFSQGDVEARSYHTLNVTQSNRCPLDVHQCLGRMGSHLQIGQLEDGHSIGCEAEAADRRRRGVPMIPLDSGTTARCVRSHLVTIPRGNDSMSGFVLYAHFISKKKKITVNK